MINFYPVFSSDPCPLCLGEDENVEKVGHSYWSGSNDFIVHAYCKECYEGYAKNVEKIKCLFCDKEVRKSSLYSWKERFFMVSKIGMVQKRSKSGNTEQSRTYPPLGLFSYERY